MKRWIFRVLLIQCHAEGGCNKVGRKQMRANASKRRQTRTNASKRRGENASKRKQTRANVDKRLHRPLLRFFAPPFAIPLLIQGPLNGGVSNGGVSRSGLVLPFLSFFVLLGLSRGFSRFVRGLSGDFPDWSFSSFSAYYQHLRGTVPKGSATQSGPFPKKVGNTRVWKPPGLASLN